MAKIDRINGTTPSDEFYTTREKVEELEARYKNLLKKFKYIICPFDSEESEFVKVLTERGYNVIHTCDDYKNHLDTFTEHKEDAIIFSNPPFSIMSEILPNLKNCGINFILMHNLMRIKDCEKFGLYGGAAGQIRTLFKNEKGVPVFMISTLNIRETYNPPKKISTTEINGKTNYKNLISWIREGKPVDCYVPTTWLLYEFANQYGYELAEPKGYFTKVYIKEKKDEQKN